MKQTPDYHNLARLTVIQHLRSYGIKIKHWNSKRAEPGRDTLQHGKVFGAPISSLPQQCIPEFGNVPVFLVEVCEYLESHVQTEGLFRKSGSVVRQKLLKSKLDRGENSLVNTPPCDVAGILKQFFRELPEPIMPACLHDPLYKAQNLSNEEEKTSATMLISCLIPENTLLILRYFFNFLHTVSMRSDSNKMDSSNLAVIFAPNLLQSEDSEKISASTEKKLRVQAAIVKTLIDQAADIGCVPDFLLEKIPGMLGVDVGADTPGSEESDLNSAETKKSRRKSVGDYVNGALNKLKTNRTPSSTPQSDRTVLSAMVTPLILTPSSKRKLPLDSVQGISSKKRKSIKQNLTFELLPSSLFGGSTPSSVKTEGSPCVSYETAESCFSPSIGGSKHLTSSANLRRSKRYETRKVQRVESGKTGCFSPKISRKEMVRRSLRLRFSLGKSSKDVNTGFTSSIQSQNIGWRLANSQELPVPEKVSELSSQAKSTCVSAGSKKISKSEENLLTPKKSDDVNHRMSWTGPLPLNGECDVDTPEAGYLYAGSCYSEPVLVAGKPPAMPKKPMSRQEDEERPDDSLCEEDNSEAQNTVRMITKAFTQSGSDLRVVIASAKSSEEGNSEPISEAKKEAAIQNSLACNNVCVVRDCADKQGTDVEENKAGPAFLSDDGSHSDRHVTPPQILRIDEEESHEDDTEASHSKPESELEAPNFQNGSLSQAFFPVSEEATDLSAAPEPAWQNKPSIPISNKASSPQSHQASAPIVLPSVRSCRVSDHIQHFNKLCLSDRSAVQNLKSPMKFQRTPVRQSVRRINSLSGTKKEVDHAQSASLPMVKSVSYDEFPSSALSLSNVTRSTRSKVTSVGSERVASYSLIGSSPRILKQNFVKLPNYMGATDAPSKSVFEDLTNQNVSRTTISKCENSANTPHNARQSLSVKELNRYRGSPKNPISRVKLLPATKPLEL